MAKKRNGWEGRSAFKKKNPKWEWTKGSMCFEVARFSSPLPPIGRRAAPLKTISIPSADDVCTFPPPFLPSNRCHANCFSNHETEMKLEKISRRKYRVLVFATNKITFPDKKRFVIRKFFSSKCFYTKQLLFFKYSTHTSGMVLLNSRAEDGAGINVQFRCTIVT